MSSPAKALFKSLKTLHRKGTYSDFTIQCGDDQYPVHKAIVCPRSTFFAKACDGPFQEGRTGVVDLGEEDPQVVRMMVHYFYHLDYPSAHASLYQKQDQTSDLIFHAQVYAAAEMYSVLGLKELALNKFKGEIYPFREVDFLRAAGHVYSDTVESDRGMRDAVVESFWGNRKSLLQKQEAKDAVKNIEGLAYDLVLYDWGKQVSRSQCLGKM